MRSRHIGGLSAIALMGFVAVVFASLYPVHAVAAEVAEVRVQTAQLLPPGGNACPALQVSGFTPYIYDGALHAFEFSVADSSYVALAGSVGRTDVPFNQMLRITDPSGAIRIHADIPSTPIRKDTTVIITMLSAREGTQVVCLSMISSTLPAEISAGERTPVPSPAPSGVSKPRPSPPTPSPASQQTKRPTSTSATGTDQGRPIATAQNILKDMCSAGGASRLWFMLLAVYTIIVAAVAFAQPQLPSALRSQEWIAAAIVVPFLLLFGLWYFVESCRISAWVPAIATLIALAGLATAFWDSSSSGKRPGIINLPGAKT